MSVIRAITISDLAALEPLLRASFGRGDFDIQDEFEVFAETQPKNWFALSDGELQGFICSFPLTQDLVLCELYVPPGPERAARLTRLLEHFRRHHRFLIGATLRLDVLEEDSELLDVLESLFPHSSTKTFAHYRITPPSKAAVQAPPALLTSDDIKEAQAILAVLKRYNVPELEQLAARKQLFVIKDSGVKAVLHVEHDGQGGSRSSPWQQLRATSGRGTHRRYSTAFYVHSRADGLSLKSTLKTELLSASMNAPGLHVRATELKSGGIFGWITREAPRRATANPL